MRIYLYITLLLVLLPGISAVGQSNYDSNFAEGEIMVQLNSEDELTSILDDYNLELKHVVSKRFNIYLLDFDGSRISNQTMITTLQSNKSVINVQNNHSITLRESDETFPNDSLLENQWAIYNYGQGSGYLGADIDARYAWDITTGGLTALGDTIVVAILDGGSDLDHEDLNFWKNHQEIPDNDIDDDNNGYVDDYDGWNAYSHNGEIPDNVHGVHVGGTAGAIGNNEVGVAGVNWNVKTLPIAGESSYESIVVEALSYIYVVRERYDQTNGAEGAFVVAQNNSFGVDKGQPDQFPIWEAMYDSLGSLGILSMGATANRNWDIDSVGDVPTAFTTDFMISVTNTTNRDEQNPSSGYGITTIDLGAPGTMIWSLGLNNTYRSSTGTSMATPHVTGAVALLMAAADSAFIAEYKLDPASGALKIKEYILGGTDSLTALDGRTVTGGRLNLFNSLNLMLLVPSLSTNMDSLTVEMPLNYTQEEELIISNFGGDTLVYSIDIEDQPGWISLSQMEGVIPEGESDTILILLSTLDIDSGDYSCIINISGEDVDTKLLPVRLLAYDDTSIPEVVSVSDVLVFPNPFTTSVNFQYTASTNGISEIEIFDLNGRSVFKENKTVFMGIIEYYWEDKIGENNLFYFKISHNDQVVSIGKIIRK